MRRQFVEDGGLAEMIENGVRGVTSNPSIFEKAIAGSSDYDDQMKELVRDGRTASEIYEALVVRDIQEAADLMRPVYDESAGIDGYVSLEVSPTLANDTAATVAEAERLHRLLDRPNVMIKVPATPAGIPAVEELIAQGISVNVTLLFSLSHYDAVAEAYLRGLERLAATGADLSRVASVASFFISRVEGSVDAALEAAGRSDLKGRTAVANAKLAYARFADLFSGERFEALRRQGAQVQRPLWASTGVKDPGYPDTKYVDGLIGPSTVNTLPPPTLDAFLDHGTVERTIDADVANARAVLNSLIEANIDLDEITDVLQTEGVEKFAESFESLMRSIEEKRARLAEGSLRLELFLGDAEEEMTSAFEKLREDRVVERIWRGDHTVWKEDPAEITNRLGWLASPQIMQEPETGDRLRGLLEAVRSDGYSKVLLLGMGGSSLAPEVFARTFGAYSFGLELSVLDSTDPDAVLAADRRHEPGATLYIVATKSGGTAETMSFFRYFYNRTMASVGEEEAGEHFVAITDPGSELEDLARRYAFRAVFANDSSIGGRYSALSFFGLVPATLVGVDVDKLLDRAWLAAVNCDRYNCPAAGDNAGARLGAVMGRMALRGKDKLTFVTSPEIAAFGDWVEQLVAESTGKEGRGIVPVVGEPVGHPGGYGNDRLFIHLRVDGDDSDDDAMRSIMDAGHPVVRINLEDAYDLGELFFLFEMATAVAGHELGINSFDQPNVEAAKKLAGRMIAVYRKEGSLPPIEDTISAGDAGPALRAFLEHAGGSAYVGFQAYLQPDPPVTEALQEVRRAVRDSSRLATTLGYGPRFLHSTGQLHKGDGGNGLFIQFTSQSYEDVAIPDEAGSAASSISFGTLEQAQMLGDRQALLDGGRRVITIDLGSDVAGALRSLAPRGGTT
jgi:transaldolase/glucose-6-phosphate isomerase